MVDTSSVGRALHLNKNIIHKTNPAAFGSYRVDYRFAYVLGRRARFHDEGVFICNVSFRDKVDTKRARSTWELNDAP